MSENLQVRQTNYLTMILTKSLVGRIIRSKVQNRIPVFNSLPGSNSNLRAARVNSELISGRIVTKSHNGRKVSVERESGRVLSMESKWAKFERRFM